MKHKALFVIIFIILLGSLKILDICKDDSKAMEEFGNSYYYDYEDNPDNFILTNATIINELKTDSDFIFNFYGANIWIIEFELPNGTVIESEVVRAEGEEIGDVIEIAYENSGVEVVTRDPHTTRLQYTEYFGEMKSIEIIETVIKMIVAVMAGLAVVLGVMKVVKK